MTERQLTEADVRTLLEQYAEAYAQSQHSYDTSVRVLAAAGVGLTASFATALHSSLTGMGEAALIVFLASLAFNLLSYATAQIDLSKRMSLLQRQRVAGARWNRWTWSTVALNLLAGFCLIAGGVLLGAYVY